MTILRGIYQYVIISILLILTWIIAYKTNGLNVTVNFFYFSVILAGRFWGFRGGIVVGLVAGVLGGPFLPDNVSNGLPQPTSQWLIRLCFYVAIGAFVGRLFSVLSQKKDELLLQKQELEVINNEITYQRDEIIKKKSEIEKNRDEIIQKKEEIEKQRDVIEAQKEHIRQFSAGLIESLAQSIEIRDSYTSGHCRRVSDMSVRIGERMGLEQQELLYLKWSGILHDIGKIGIPEAILTKEGKLTQYEYEVMKQHPALGAKILSGIPYADHILEGVLHHHERIDGKGYPDGLVGEEIGLQARILAVADVWDALTSKRSYRDALSRNDALEIMKSGRGSQFDPIVLDHFLKVISEDYKQESIKQRTGS